jgi:hypothetical protein
MELNKYDQIDKDLEALWSGIPDETRIKLDKLPPGIRDFYLNFARSYAKSAYKLGAKRERQDCHEVLKDITERFHPERSLDSFSYSYRSAVG